MENILTVLTYVCAFILGAFSPYLICYAWDRMEIIINNLVNKPRLYKAQSDMIDRLQNENREIRKQLRKEGSG